MSTTLVIAKRWPSAWPSTTGLATVKAIIASVCRSKTSQPPGRSQPGKAPQGRPQAVGGEVVQAVERRDRGVEEPADREVGERLPAEDHVGAQQPAGAGEHGLRGVHPGDPVAEARSARRPAGPCRNRRRGRCAPRWRRRPTARAGRPPSAHGRGPRRSRRRPLRAGRTDRPRSRGSARASAEPRSDAEDLGLGGRELLVGQDALLVQLRELLQLGGLVVLRPERRGRARRLLPRPAAVVGSGPAARSTWLA